jgi:hypothetical protein
MSSSTVPTKKDNDDERRARIEELVARVKVKKEPAASQENNGNPRQGRRKPARPKSSRK